jgi:hypothetical protein
MPGAGSDAGAGTGQWVCSGVARRRSLIQANVFAFGLERGCERIHLEGQTRQTRNQKLETRRNPSSFWFLVSGLRSWPAVLSQPLRTRLLSHPTTPAQDAKPRDPRPRPSPSPRPAFDLQPLIRTSPVLATLARPLIFSRSSRPRQPSLFTFHSSPFQPLPAVDGHAIRRRQGSGELRRWKRATAVAGWG